MYKDLAKKNRCQKNLQSRWEKKVSGLGQKNRPRIRTRLTRRPCKTLGNMLFSQHGIRWKRSLCCLPPSGNRQLCKETLVKPMENTYSSLGALCVTTCVIGQRQGRTRLGGKPYKTNGNNDPGKELCVLSVPTRRVNRTAL